MYGLKLARHRAPPWADHESEPFSLQASRPDCAQVIRCQQLSGRATFRSNFQDTHQLSNFQDTHQLSAHQLSVNFQDTHEFKHEFHKFREFRDTHRIPASEFLDTNSWTRAEFQRNSRTDTTLGRESQDSHDFRDSNLSKLRKFGSASFSRCQLVPGTSFRGTSFSKFQDTQVSGHARLQPRICAMIPSPRTVEAIAQT